MGKWTDCRGCERKRGERFCSVIVNKQSRPVINRPPKHSCYVVIRRLPSGKTLAIRRLLEANIICPLLYIIDLQKVGNLCVYCFIACQYSACASNTMCQLKQYSVHYSSLPKSNLLHTRTLHKNMYTNATYRLQRHLYIPHPDFCAPIQR